MKFKTQSTSNKPNINSNRSLKASNKCRKYFPTFINVLLNLSTISLSQENKSNVSSYQGSTEGEKNVFLVFLLVPALDCPLTFCLDAQWKSDFQNWADKKDLLHHKQFGINDSGLQKTNSRHIMYKDPTPVVVQIKGKWQMKIVILLWQILQVIWLTVGGNGPCGLYRKKTKTWCHPSAACDSFGDYL